MKTRLLGCVAALSLLGVGCDQPEPDCSASHLSFAARMAKTSGDDACRLLGPYTGDVLGVETYYPSLGGDPPRPDVEHPFIAIKASTLQGIYGAQASAYGVGDPDADVRDPTPTTRQFYALGDFTGVDPVDQLCTVPTFRSRAEYISTEFPAVTCGGTGGGGGAGGAGGGDATGGAGGCVEDPGTPAFNITQEWSNFRMVDRDDAVGTVFTAQMTYSEAQTVAGDTISCGATYDVIAIAPPIDCSVYDADGAPTGEPDPALCDPEPDVAAGRLAGSGLNPKLTSLIQCLDSGAAPGPFRFGGNFQCVLVANSVEEVKAALDAE
ncbi:MAG: hypothetical protein WKG00_26915 [Polyangiaceae bacterium]